MYLFLEGLSWLGVCKPLAIRNDSATGAGAPHSYIPSRKAIGSLERKRGIPPGQVKIKGQSTMVQQDHGPAWNLGPRMKEKYTEQGLFPERQSHRGAV